MLRTSCAFNSVSSMGSNDNISQPEGNVIFADLLLNMAIQKDKMSEGYPELLCPTHITLSLQLGIGDI